MQLWQSEEEIPRTLYNVHSQETMTLGSPIVQVNGNDEDSGLFGQLKYSIMSGNQGNKFRIDESTGTIRLVSPLGQTHRNYQLVVGATDGGKFMSVTRASVLIIVSSIPDLAKAIEKDQQDRPPKQIKTIQDYTNRLKELLGC